MWLSERTQIIRGLVLGVKDRRKKKHNFVKAKFSLRVLFLTLQPELSTYTEKVCSAQYLEYYVLY